MSSPHQPNSSVHLRVIASNVKARRRRLGISQDEVAKRANAVLGPEVTVSRSYIAKIEHEYFEEIGYTRLAAIARALHCTVADLAGETSSDASVINVNPEKAGRLQQIGRYPADVLDAALDFMDRLGGRIFLEQPKVEEQQGHKRPEDGSDQRTGQQEEPDDAHTPNESRG